MEGAARSETQKIAPNFVIKMTVRKTLGDEKCIPFQINMKFMIT